MTIALLDSPLSVADARRQLADPDLPLVLIERDPPLRPATIRRQRARAPFIDHAEGEPGAISAAFRPLGDELAEDAGRLAAFFAELTGASILRARVEGVVTDHCKRLHADHVDLRLITAYAGAGTDHAPSGDPDRLARVPTGWIGLFKGERFGAGHRPCLHRSPRIAEAGEARLLLVLDTPLLDPEN